MAGVMAYLTALALALGIAVDGAVVVASRALAGRRSRSLPWLFGASHAVMATLGWAIGRRASVWIQEWDHWVAFALLTLIGGRMIVAPDGREDAPSADGGWEVFGLCVATSIDAAAGGVTIDALGIAPALTIGLITCICTALSMTALAVGERVGVHAGRNLSRVGGLVLVVIAIRVVVQHTS
jgi:putative Mn2+ efflux pump MntP